MKQTPGIITLMGSGELTTTMVEVHKALINRYGDDASAVFIDTPAGFQLNVDHIAGKAADYFNKRVQRPLALASLKSAQPDNPLALETCYQTVQRADYILIGPGSPTYALEQWQQTRIPDLLVKHIETGGCLVAASAAALTVGRLTLPVYEIYKVGQSPHWVQGLNILHHFGMDWVVVPHWNNAEGGNHDTRYCFMGEPRLKQLETMMPENTGILGLDEHTALIIDLHNETTHIRGMGKITLRKGEREQVFDKADPPSLALLRGQQRTAPTAKPATQPNQTATPPTATQDPVWEPVESLAETIQQHLTCERIEPATHTMLELERHIRQVYDQLQERSAEGAAAEVLRNMIALFGTRLAERPVDRESCLAPLVDRLLALRDRLRQEKQYAAADSIRDCLTSAGIVVEDTARGARWQIL